MTLTVQSLWVGNRLSRMEHYSIKSFLKLGYKFILYTYEPVANIPWYQLKMVTKLFQK